MTATIYKIPIPEPTVPTEQDALGTQLSEQGVLGSDAIVESISSQAADLTLTGRYAYGTYYSELLATELEELADSSVSAVPLYGGAGNRAGYYAIESAQVEPVHAGGRDIWEWTLSLTSRGTRKSQFQALATNITQPAPTHPFGTETTAVVGIPAAAALVRAVDAASTPTQRLRPTPDATVSTEFGDVDLFDATTLSIDDPLFVYDVAKDAQPAVDARVYDSLGRDSKFIESGDGRVRAWQAVFATDHEFNGPAVLSNGRLRVTFDEPTASDPSAGFTAETYDAGADAWSAVDLPDYDADIDTDWQPADVDLTAIGQARVAAQVEFEAVAGANAGDVYSVDVELERGRADLEVYLPETVTEAIPPDLEALLAPLASASVGERRR